MTYDIIIIGGGPAGVTSAIYAIRANKKVLLLEKEIIGGKVASSPLIENYPGIMNINGVELSEDLNKQLNNFGVEILRETVIDLQYEGAVKKIITKDEIYEAKAIIIATGTKYKKLGIEKEDEFIGKGISFCAVCDGFFYKNKTVAVIGGGNTGVANALELANVCKKIYLVQNQEYLTAEYILTEQLYKNKKIEILYNYSITRLLGEQKLSGIELTSNNQTKILEVDGMFLAIGQIPETEFINKEKVKVDEMGYIIIDENCKTNIEGIFAGGDCVSKEIRQLTTAVSDGTIAALNAIKYLSI